MPSKDAMIRVFFQHALLNQVEGIFTKPSFKVMKPRYHPRSWKLITDSSTIALHLDPRIVLI